jgi:hypothetical protein
MDSTLATAFEQQSPVKATLVRFDLPGSPLCLTDGGFAVFDAGEGEGAETYVACHPVYGVLGSVPSIKDGAGQQTTRLAIEVLPASDDAAAALASPTLQGTRVQWWEGVIDRATGGLIGVPELKYDGVLDKPKFRVAESWSLTLECGTEGELQLEPNADWRLNNAFHQRIWGLGELGFAFVTSVTRKLEWRERPPNPGLFKRLLNFVSPITREKII